MEIKCTKPLKVRNELVENFKLFLRGKSAQFFFTVKKIRNTNSFLPFSLVLIFKIIYYKHNIIVH